MKGIILLLSAFIHIIKVFDSTMKLVLRMKTAKKETRGERNILGSYPTALQGAWKTSQLPSYLQMRMRTQLRNRNWDTHCTYSKY